MTNTKKSYTQPARWIVRLVNFGIKAISPAQSNFCTKHSLPHQKHPLLSGLLNITNNSASMPMHCWPQDTLTRERQAAMRSPLTLPNSSPTSPNEGEQSRLLTKSSTVPRTTAPPSDCCKQWRPPHDLGHPNPRRTRHPPSRLPQKARGAAVTQSDSMQSSRFEIDGSSIQSLEDFYRAIGEAVGGPGGYFGSNLDALDDCLSGGCGAEPPCLFVWTNHKASRAGLGYSETIRQLEYRLVGCDPTARDLVATDLELAKRGKGPTVFDWLISIFQDHNSEGVKLVLD